MIHASSIYALSQGSNNTGDQECHWCGGPCKMFLPHDDIPYHLPFCQHKEPTKRPGCGWICWGCWLWHRPRITIHFFSGSFLDSKTPADFSWLITERGSWALRDTDYPALFDFLLKPSGSFTLSIRSSGGPKNYLQLAVGNDLSAIDANTPIGFTINNVSHQYSIYELEKAIKEGPEGKEPGIRALFDLWTPPKPAGNGVPEKRGRGRPKKEEEEDGRITQRTVRRSGY